MIKLPKVQWKSLLVAGILFLASSLVVIACTPQETTPPQQLKLLNVGSAPWPGYAAHYVAVAKDMFKAEGILVKDAPFGAQADSDAAFLAKRLDLTWTGLPNIVTFVESHPDTKIIFQSDYSDGADGIVARGIKTKESIKGQKLARESSVFSEVEIERYLEQLGASRSDLTIIDLSAPEAADAFIKGKVNLAVTYEPSLTKAAKEGKGEVVFSTKDSNIIPDGLIASEALIKDHKTELIAYLRAIEKATQLIKEKPAEVAPIIAKAVSVKPEEVAGQMALIKLFDMKMNQTISFNPSDPNSLFESLNYTNKVAKKLKLTTKDVDVKSALKDDIVKSIQ
jgi:NitT/TauT family transport system substrate-binding protein